MIPNFVQINGIKHPIFISTGALSRNMLIDDMIPLLQEKGIKNLELASGARFENRESILKAKDSFNFMIHNYFPVPEVPQVLNTAVDDKETYEFVSRSIEFCKDLGSDIYSVHAGYVSRFKSNELGNVNKQKKMTPVSLGAYRRSYDEFIGCANNILIMARKQGVNVFFENNGISKLSLNDHDEAPRSHLARVVDYHEFCADVPNAGLLYDVAHARISSYAFGEDPEFHFRAFSSSIKAFHLSDNNGISDTNDPICDESWFLPYLKQFLKRSKFPTPLVIEVYDISPAEICEQISLLEARLR